MFWSLSLVAKSEICTQKNKKNADVWLTNMQKIYCYQVFLGWRHWTLPETIYCSTILWSINSIILLTLYGTKFLYTVVMPCNLGQSWANIYGSSVCWPEITRMSINLSAIYIGRNQNSINNIAWVKVWTWWTKKGAKLSKGQGGKTVFYRWPQGR